MFRIILTALVLAASPALAQADAAKTPHDIYIKAMHDGRDASDAAAMAATYDDMPAACDLSHEAQDDYQSAYDTLKAMAKDREDSSDIVAMCPKMDALIADAQSTIDVVCKP